ncbi:MAG TPA: hypothetical protein VF071_03725 [Candidatus Limnocylindria bacterium]
MFELVEPLSLTALIAATLQYAILVRHREERRDEERYLYEAEAAGRQALFRARLLDRGRSVRQWSTAGTRFR